MAIDCLLLSEAKRTQHTAALFGHHFPLQLEPVVFQFASMLSSGYNGGYWEFYELSNGGFYMAPHSDRSFSVVCDNGFKGRLSADALGITACLYAYSHLSFSRDEQLKELYARHYYLLRDYLLEHPEAGDIHRAID